MNDEDYHKDVGGVDWTQSRPSIVMPRDQLATMAADWAWVERVLRMCRDRALTGTPLHIKKPRWFPPKGDVKLTVCWSAHRMIDEIFSTAIVDEPDTEEESEDATTELAS